MHTLYSTLQHGRRRSAQGFVGLGVERVRRGTTGFLAFVHGLYAETVGNTYCLPPGIRRTATSKIDKQILNSFFAFRG